MYALIVAGVALMGYDNIPAHVSGSYWSSCDTSYCRAAEVHCTPQASVKSILNRPTGYGYSVTYNYGLQPAPTGSWSGGGSSSYNHGGYRMK